MREGNITLRDLAQVDLLGEGSPEIATTGRWGAFSLYVIGSIVLGLAATAVGFVCTRG